MAQQTLDMLLARGNPYTDRAHIINKSYTVPSSATLAKIDIKNLELKDLYTVQAELRQQMVVEESNKK